jgi:hypothetical protein
MQEKLAELATSKGTAARDFEVSVCNFPKPLAQPRPFCTAVSAHRWPPPLHIWLADQGLTPEAESGFRYKGYQTVDDMLRNKTMDARELRLCGIPTRAARTKLLSAIESMRGRWDAQGGKPTGGAEWLLKANGGQSRMERSSRLCAQDMWRG